jgi:hypothetical protein
MTIRAALPLATLALLPLLFAFAAAPRTQDLARPYVQWVGPESKYTTGFHLIRDDKAWTNLWSIHAGLPKIENRHAVPKVDFNQCIVVAFFRGPSTNEDGEELQSFGQEPDLLRLRFESSTFQTSGTDGRGGSVDTHPFGIWVLPGTKTQIVIEEGRRTLKDQPITYKEVHRFPAAR